jgi:predicted PurR-regulated permease PerM
MNLSRTVEYIFFFALLGLAGYMVWLIAKPFIGALALAAIIVTICQPIYNRIERRVPKRNKTIAALISTVVVLILVVIPLVLMSSLVVRELVGFYQDLNNTDNFTLQGSFDTIEHSIQAYFPSFNINLKEQLAATGGWLLGNAGAIFASTVSTIFVFFIAIIGSFYFFRDGRELMQLLIKASPLPDHEDAIIFARMAQAVRAVATGTLLLAIIQGSLVAIGFTLFGIDRAILWGSLASVGALVPGVGTTIVTLPAIIYLFVVGNTFSAVGLLLWSVMLVGLIDNILGPNLIARKNNMHPLIILISVLGGLGLFGPIGFIVGPVIVTLFLVLLELYSQYIVQEKSLTETTEIL